MRLISPPVPHHVHLLSSYLLLVSPAFYPHNQKSSRPTATSTKKRTAPAWTCNRSLAQTRSLHAAAAAGKGKRGGNACATANAARRTASCASSTKRLSCSSRRDRLLKVPASAITTINTTAASVKKPSCHRRNYSSSTLSSVTGLTQELLRITAFRNSSLSARAMSMGMDPPTGDHLVVLVHGLWGNPTHMEYLAESLKSRYDDSQLIVHVAARNSGNHTYDGIELGGERLAKEIEDLIEDLQEKGTIIRKFSIVGYSLGGLVSRYVVGVLYSKGLFSKITPVNFTTFASPHLGVRTPKLGIHNHIWNVIGARTLSASGRQLFTIDSFRDTQRPLLSVLADKNLAFWKGLKMFRNKVLYANIVNDRSTTFFTSGISRCDPFADLDMVDYKYLPGYDNILIDDEAGVRLKSQDEEGEDDDPARDPSRVVNQNKVQKRGIREFIRDLPFLALYAMLVPVGFCFFLANAAVQTYSSTKRIRMHRREVGYEVPLSIAEEVQDAMDEVVEELERSTTADYLDDGASISPTQKPLMVKTSSASASDNTASGSGDSIDQAQKRVEEALRDMPEFPTLALAPQQFEMIEALDELGFRKFPVHIKKVKHAHAAIIVRNPGNEGFSEGKVVVGHWLDGQFEV